MRLQARFFVEKRPNFGLFFALFFYGGGSKKYAYSGRIDKPVCYLTKMVDILMRFGTSPWFPIFHML